ncbi:FAD-dependent oxidoreductase [Microbacterium sp.]|uniref:FAD-dependent oxidoreductase n=1 Tax=Microbacterium sp. TaxID=51671 RepID=UPI003C72AE1D
MAEDIRVAVVGAGVVGLSTAWALTRHGLRPIVFDRFARGHREGASHGATRNFNNAYAEQHYLDLLARAREGWDALGVVEGEPLLRLHGLVTHGGEGLEQIDRALRERGIASELLDAPEASARWPGLRFEPVVLYSPDAGVARADVALRELERRVVAGGQVHWETPVTAVRDEGDAVSLTLADGAPVGFDVVVVTVGAWSAALLPGIPLPPLRVTEEGFAHFAPVRDDLAWPSFNHAAAGFPAYVYGMPTPGEGIKVGFHRVGAEVDPDRRPRRIAFPRELSEYAREWLPGVDPERAAWVSCTYTSTPDAAFVLDRVGRIVVGAGFSGHGFKFAPGVGATLADLVLDPSVRAAAPFRLPSPRL